MPNTVVRVLLIEDDVHCAQNIRLGLAKAASPFAVQSVGRWSDAKRRLDQGGFDAILADLTLPDSHELETVSRLRSHAPDVPLVVLLDMVDDELALATLQHGAQEYLIKNCITPKLLERSIRGAIAGLGSSRMRRRLASLRAATLLLERKNRRLSGLNRMAHHAVDNVSHGFRTPLTVIAEYVSLLRDGVVGQLDLQQCRMLDVIGDRADDLNNMVDDMLDVSKLQAGRLSVYRKRCAVATIVDHVRPSLDRKAAIRNARFSVAVDENLPEVFCDPDKVGRIIVNLAVNAVKFCGNPGDVRLWARSDPEDSQVIVGVTDNGPGIEEEQLAALFRRFSRLDAPPNGQDKGFGLGLSIAKELVEMNLGQLSVESQPDEGSTFFFTLPLANPDAVVPRYVDWMAGRHRSGVLSVLTATIDESTPAQTADEVNAFLSYALRQDDLLLGVAPCHWLLVTPVRSERTQPFIDRMKQLRHDTNRNRPQGPLPEISIHVDLSCRLDAARGEILAHLHTLAEAMAAG